MSEQPTGLRAWLARLLLGRDFARQLAAVSVRVDDSPGWQSESAGRHDRDWAEIQQLYNDALTAWRKNPLAKRIIDITTDYVLGDGVELDAPGDIGRFIRLWWDHPQNRMELRLPDLVDELSRAGDVFITLHRNANDGMSYVRPIPKDVIEKIETAPNDWETELAYYETRPAGEEPRRWLSPAHPDADNAPALMLHYAINKPIGALMGESDLAPAIPWLLRYSRMLEDRVRLNWAMRAFLWIVTVPSNRVQDKTNQYRTAPEPGSVIVKDDAETWEPVAPSLHAGDARHDLMAVRRMVQAGTYPPHWMGDPEDSNLATAAAMNDPAVRHLRRRQLYISWMLMDLAHTAYSRAYAIGRVKRKPDLSLITVTTPDISRDDNGDLATAARDLASAMTLLRKQIGGGDRQVPTLARYVLRIVSKFAGEPLDAGEIDAILDEAAELQADADAAAEAIAESQPPAEEPTGNDDDDGSGDGAV